MDQRNISPHFTLLCIVALGVLSALLMLAVPPGGWDIGPWKIHFRQLHTLLGPVEKPAIENVEAYLEQLEHSATDSLRVADVTTQDSLSVIEVKRSLSKTSIQFVDDDSSPLFAFFSTLKKADGPVHVLHYGDSQIESDRITRYLRQKLQEEFGGNGPGLVSPVPVAQPGNISLSKSDNWKRYTAYGFQEKKSPHDHYGIMCSYARYTDAANANGDTTEAYLEFSPSRFSFGKAKLFNHAKLFLRNVGSEVGLKVLLNDSLIDQLVLTSDSSMQEFNWHFPSTPGTLRFDFRGVDSPEIHALCFSDNTGIQVDNIALRGSNGNIFKRINSIDLKAEISSLNCHLILLQFGGNALPYIDSKKSAEQYGEYFQAQIRFLKKIAPNASFIVIGPSDMSTTVDGELQTFPFLEATRDALKKAAWEEKCGFWDLYEVMGGKNSMLSWVTNDPPYAGPDYTHFTPLGARKVAELLHKAIDEEYEAWKNGKVVKIPSDTSASKVPIHTNFK